MKIASITTTKDLDKMAAFDSDYYMALHHLLISDEDYKSHFMDLKAKNKDAFIIYDNGANETDAATGMELIEGAGDCFADEIIAPDKFNDGTATLCDTELFLDKYYDEYIKNYFSVMAVPQGQTTSEYMECFNHFINDPRINTIGLGYRTMLPAFMDEIAKMKDKDWKAWGIDEIKYLRDNLEENTYYYTLSRIYFLKNFVNFRKLAIRKKRIHLLGIYNPYELSFYNRCFTKSQLSKIRGVDSAAAMQAAQVEVTFDKTYGVRTKPKAYLSFYDKLTDDQLISFECNISIIKDWMNTKKATKR